MAVYTFHVPRDAMPGDRAALERAVLVRDGFSWGALIFQLLWCLWNRLWLIAIGVILISTVLSFGLELAGLPEVAIGAAGFLFALWFAFEANNLRRMMLERRGLVMRGVVVARNEEEAERRAFAIWLKDQEPQEVSEKHKPQAEEAATSVRSAVYNPGIRDTGIIGLFPSTEERR